MIEGTNIDLIIHGLTLVVATYLFLVSYKSYRLKNNKKFFYVCLAFGTFALKEMIVTLSVIGLNTRGLIGISHILNLVILGLFFWGTVK